MRILVRLFALAALFASALVWGQAYPNKPLRLIVPFGPGGAADAIARPLAENDQIGKRIAAEPVRSVDARSAFATGK